MLSFSRAITDNAERLGDGTAITCGDESVSWRELDRRTNRMARAFADLGVSEGSLVTIALPNSIAFLELSLIHI